MKIRKYEMQDLSFKSFLIDQRFGLIVGLAITILAVGLIFIFHHQKQVVLYKQINNIKVVNI